MILTGSLAHTQLSIIIRLYIYIQQGGREFVSVDVFVASQDLQIDFEPSECSTICFAHSHEDLRWPSRSLYNKRQQRLCDMSGMVRIMTTISGSPPTFQRIKCISWWGVQYHLWVWTSTGPVCLRVRLMLWGGRWVPRWAKGYIEAWGGRFRLRRRRPGKGMSGRQPQQTRWSSLALRGLLVAHEGWCDSGRAWRNDHGVWCVDPKLKHTLTSISRISNKNNIRISTNMKCAYSHWQICRWS